MNTNLQQIEQLTKYVDLGKRLLDVVDDKDSDNVFNLIHSLEQYKTNLSNAQKQHEIELRKTAEADQKLASVESLLLKAYHGDTEKTNAKMSQLSKQSHRQRYWCSFGKAVSYGVRSALVSPFSLGESRKFYELYKIYSSSAKTAGETMKVVADTDRIKTKVLRSKSEREVQEARTSALYCEMGIDEKVADAFAKNPEQFAFAYFEYLKREYDVE